MPLEKLHMTNEAGTTVTWKNGTRTNASRTNTTRTNATITNASRTNAIRNATRKTSHDK